MRQRRAEAAERQQRWERDQARRTGAGAADAGPVTFAEVVEEMVAAVSPAIAPASEALPPRQQRPRRRDVETTSGIGNGQRNGHGRTHADAWAGDSDVAHADGNTIVGVSSDDYSVEAADGGEPAMVLTSGDRNDGDDAGAV